MKNVLVFRRVHYDNFILCYILSFFWEVKTFQFCNPRVKTWLKNVELFSWGEHLQWEERIWYTEESLKLWETGQIKLKDPDKKFSINILRTVFCKWTI